MKFPERAPWCKFHSSLIVDAFARELDASDVM